jgi:predicted PurR-regulated permease PerM
VKPSIAKPLLIDQVSNLMAKITPAQSKTSITEAEFVRFTLIFVGIVALALAFYKLSDIILLVFGSILVAVILRAIARPIMRGTAMSERLALLASGLGVAAVLGGTGYLFGSRISEQLSVLAANLPQATERLAKSVPSVTDWVKGSAVGDLIINAFSWGTTVFGAAAALVVVVVAGIYIAIKP